MKEMLSKAIENKLFNLVVNIKKILKKVKKKKKKKRKKIICPYSNQNISEDVSTEPT